MQCTVVLHSKISPNKNVYPFVFTPRKLLVCGLYTYVLRFCNTIDGYKCFERTCCCQLHDSAAKLCYVTSKKTQRHCFSFFKLNSYNSASLNPLNAELNPICYLLALLGAHHFLHVSRIKVNHWFLLNSDSTSVYIW